MIICKVLSLPPSHVKNPLAETHAVNNYLFLYRYKIHKYNSRSFTLVYHKFYCTTIVIKRNKIKHVIFIKCAAINLPLLFFSLHFYKLGQKQKAFFLLYFAIKYQGFFDKKDNSALFDYSRLRCLIPNINLAPIIYRVRIPERFKITITFPRVSVKF